MLLCHQSTDHMQIPALPAGGVYMSSPVTNDIARTDLVRRLHNLRFCVGLTETTYQCVRPLTTYPLSDKALTVSRPRCNLGKRKAFSQGCQSCSCTTDQYGRHACLQTSSYPNRNLCSRSPPRGYGGSRHPCGSHKDLGQ